MKINNPGTVFVLILIIYSTTLNRIEAQDVEGSMLFSSNLVSNPAFSGAQGPGILRLGYRDYYPGNNLNLGTFYIGYDTFLEPVHGGIGFFLQENKLGEILNDFRAGATYAYHLRADRELFINAGFTTTVIYRSVNKSGLILPDQIDPILGPIYTSGEVIDLRSRLLFDIGVGFLFSYRNLNAGIAINHLGKPDLTGFSVEKGRLKRRLTFHFNAEFETGLNKLTLSPVAFLNLQDNFLSGAGGMVASYKLLSLSVIGHIGQNDGLYSLQPGFTFETGRVIIGYHYFFSPLSNEPGLPTSQSNLVTLSFSLNNVDKRGVMKAIKYPKL